MILTMSPKIKLSNIEAVLACEPLFSRSPDSWNFDQWGQSAEFYQFIQTLQTNQFIYPFDWSTWSLQFGRERVFSSLFFQDADLAQIQKAMTTVARAERFSQGIYPRLVREGYFYAMLRRLRLLYEKQDDPQLAVG